MLHHKILIVANDSSYTYNLRDVLIQRLISAGYEVVVCCECQKFKEELCALGARLIDIKISRHSKNPLSDLSLLNRLWWIVRKEKPEVVLTYNIKPNVYGGMVCRLAGIPYIPNVTGLGIAVENGGITSYISRKLYKIGISGASCVMFQNEDNLKFFINSKLLRKGESARLLPGSGVNLNKFSYEQYPPASSPVILSVIGRIMKDKGVDELFEAAAIVKQKYNDVQFRMIGSFDEDYQNKVHIMVEKGLVEYVGEQNDVRPFINGSWAIIHPSHHEGMANVILESAASGRPVIATNIPGCREAIEDHSSGFLFSLGSSESLAKSIINFLELTYDRKCQMGKHARIKMEQEFDRNIVAQIYIDEIKNLTIV